MLVVEEDISLEKVENQIKNTKIGSNQEARKQGKVKEGQVIVRADWPNTLL